MKQRLLSLRHFPKIILSVSIIKVGLLLSGCDPAVTLIFRPVQQSNTRVRIVVKKEVLVHDSVLIKMSTQGMPHRFHVAHTLAELALISDSTERSAILGVGVWKDKYWSVIAEVVDTLELSNNTSTFALTDSVSLYRYLQSQPLSGLFGHKLYIP